MWIVQLALRRPYTFVVMAVLIAVSGSVTINRMSTDIFPEIDIPVVAAIWSYQGLPPDEMETRIVGSFERVLVSTVNDIEHIESQSLNGIAVVKIYLQPGARVETAIAQITSASQAVVRTMPVGTQPPLIMRFSATNVPIIQASLGGETLSEQQLFDIATNYMRPALATVRGAQVPYPYGGKQRQIMVDIDPEKLFGWNLSAADISNTLNAQNLILPGGTTKIGEFEYVVRVNSSPPDVAALNDIPIKTVNGRTIYLRDVARVRDGAIPQTNIVNVDGARGVLQPVLKSGSSTLEIVDGVKTNLPGILDTLPKDLKLNLVGDQSIFVRAAIEGVLKEAAIAAGLTALMILLFLGSWRSMFIVCVSIPLSILVSILALAACGQTLNIMTLGGMALAVGILVDDATVTIENVHRNLRMKKGLVPAILDGAQQIATPAFVSTLCICIVFVPVVFINGVAKSLFTPLAMAVVFAMLTSYFLSRTLVPTMIHYFLPAELSHQSGAVRRSIFGLIHAAFNQAFNALRLTYGKWLAWTLDHRLLTVAAFLLFSVGSCALFPLIGQDFFPTVDSGQIRFHVRAPPGTRIEETERYFGKIEALVHELIPPGELKTTLDNIGIPNSGINLTLSDGTLISSADGEVLVTLEEKHAPTAQYVRALRKALAEKFPELTVFFSPPDISTQVLNFGLSAPIDIQITGPRRNLAQNLEVAEQLRLELAQVPGLVDVHLQQVTNAPQLTVNVNRSMSNEMGVAQKDVASDVLVSLSSSSQAAPNYWLDPNSGVQYIMAVQTPQYKVDSINVLQNTPVSAGGQDQPQLLGNLADVKHTVGPVNVTHYNVAPTFDVLANVQDQDLGRVSVEIDRVLDKVRKTLPRGTTFTLRGQMESMKTSFRGLAYGLIFAVLLVYLLLVMNFQSWVDPLIILGALPGALSGILWILFATGTSICVPSLMGAIMSIGTATANSILVVTFANDKRAEGFDAKGAAWLAGMTRLRPVLMTALAMILGMVPMSLGLGEGGEQNAPLGRAVIGGLTCATFATLFFVPVVYSLARRRAPNTAVHAALSEHSSELATKA